MGPGKVWEAPDSAGRRPVHPALPQRKAWAFSWASSLQWCSVVRAPTGLGLLLGLWPLPQCPQMLVLGPRDPSFALSVDVDFFFIFLSFLFEISFALAGLDSGKLSHSSDRSYGPSRGCYSTSSYPHRYYRSSGWAAGAGRVDNPYSNCGCPPRTDRGLSHGGNFQASFSWSPR